VRKLIVSSEKCIGCRACSLACPEDYIKIEEAESEISVEFPPGCDMQCTKCVDICPTHALTLTNDTPEKKSVKLWFEMAECEACGRFFAPKMMLKYIIRRLEDTGLADEKIAWLMLCPTCRHSISH